MLFENDKISAIMPVCNSSEFLKETIDSVLAQTYTNFEFLIINDNPVNEIIEIINSYKDDRIKLINEEGIGYIAALNKGIELSCGEFILRVDIDTISLNNRFEKEIDFLKKNPDVSFVGSYQEHFGKRNFISKPACEPDILKMNLVFTCNICNSTIMFRKEDFIKNNLFYSINSLQEDFELYSKGLNSIKMAVIPEVLCKRRETDDNFFNKTGLAFVKYQQKISKDNLIKYFNLDLADDEINLISHIDYPYYWKADKDSKIFFQKKFVKILKKIEKANKKNKFYSSKNIKKALSFYFETVFKGECFIATKYSKTKLNFFKTLAQRFFYICNTDRNYKVINILGLELKIKNYKKELFEQMERTFELKKSLYYYMLSNTPQYGAEVLFNKDKNYKIVCSSDAKNYHMLPLEYLIEKDIFDYDFENPLADCYVLWGTAFWEKQYFCTSTANLFKKPLVVVEDGFLKSVASPWDKTADIKYKYNLAYTINSRTVYFDSTDVSELEKLLNNENLVITEEQKERARACIDKIVQNNLTKYNHQPIFTPKIGREGAKKILVIDQSYGDMAISRANASDDTFKNMLECAIKENPDADIIVKTHPDTILGAKSGYFTGIERKGNVYPYTEAINPISLIKYCDEVYVCSSQMGFEALMCNKKVHNFGIAFYSNYGLTLDRQNCPRRTVKRTLEEAFYIIYIMFSYYVNPLTRKRCEIEEIIDYIIEKRTQYFEEINV